MPRPKGSKNKKVESFTDNDVADFLGGFKTKPLKSKVKKKGWPKGKKRGPRKQTLAGVNSNVFQGIKRSTYPHWQSKDANHQAHLKAHAELLKKYPLSDPKMDFKVLLVTLAKTILTFFKK